MASSYGSGVTLGQPGAFGTLDNNAAASLSGTGGNIAIPSVSFSGDFALQAWTKFSSTPSSASAIVGIGAAGNDIDFNSSALWLYSGSATIATSGTAVSTSGGSTRTRIRPFHPASSAARRPTIRITTTMKMATG